MAWNERDFRNISIRNLNICTMRLKLVGGDCWYRKKAKSWFTIHSKSLTDLYFFKRVGNKGKIDGPVSAGITKAQKSYIELSDVLSIKSWRIQLRVVKSRCLF